MGAFQTKSINNIDELKAFAKDKIVVLAKAISFNYETYKDDICERLIVYNDLKTFYEYLAALAIENWQFDIDVQLYDTLPTISSNGFAAFVTTDENNNIVSEEYYAAFDGTTFTKIDINMEDFEEATKSVYASLKDNEDKLFTEGEDFDLFGVIGRNPVRDAAVIEDSCELPCIFENEILGGNIYFDVYTDFYPEKTVVAKSDWTIGLTVYGSTANRPSKYNNNVTKSFDEAMARAKALDHNEILAKNLTDAEIQMINNYFGGKVVKCEA